MHTKYQGYHGWRPGMGHPHHGHHWHRPPIMFRRGGVCRGVPLALFFGFGFFLLTKLAFLLPILIIGGALWWMMSPNLRRWGHDAWQQMENGWQEKPKRDGDIGDEKPKRNDQDDYI